MSTSGTSQRLDDLHSSPHPHQRPGVMTRLHALFPSYESHAESVDTSKMDGSRGNAHRRRKSKPPLPPKFLKVRMLTWNMHDSLPKGDLEDLLGAINDGSTLSTPPGGVPDLPLDAEHPFHLVVVAGQECPSISGIPMGLGAGFKLPVKDKDRDKSKEKEKDKDRDVSERSGSDTPEKEKDDIDEEKEKRRPRSRHLSVRHYSHRHSHEEPGAMTGSSSQDHTNQSHHPYGWTSILEDWYANGGSAAQASPAAHTSCQEGYSPTGYLDGSDVALSAKAKSTGDLNLRMNAHRKGPYELLVKERMMGIYLAIFIHRDIRDLVRGTSKSAVTAGLIGGRVGNKGGVGISLNLNGTTMLFINAHLAAHEGKVHHRVANYNKIKSELTVDDFLPSDDPRFMAEDITDRFDFSFLCGDLNFRLDITRLHADWLISRREYAQALAFDQLHKVMESGEAFVGFNEGAIDFPPTFKYDVLRYKRSKRNKSMKRLSRQPDDEAQTHVKLLTEVEEVSSGPLDEDRSEGEQENDEAVSLASTAWTGQSKYTDVEDDENEEFFYGAPSPRLRDSVGNLINKTAASAAVHKAKAKWISLIHSNGSSTAMPILKRLKNKSHASENTATWRPGSPHSSLPSPPLTLSMPNSPPPEFKALTFPPTPGKDDGNDKGLPNDKLLMPPRSVEPTKASAPLALVAQSASSKSTDRLDQEEEKDGKGVYDSSHKRRVPSWCDRILWKSNTIYVPEPEVPEEKELPPPPLPSRNRVGTFFHSLRPGSARSRKNSTASLDVPPYFSTPDSQHASPEIGSGEDSPVFSFDAGSTPRPDGGSRLKHSASMDHLALSQEMPTHPRLKSHIPVLDHPRVRQTSLQSLPTGREPPSPAFRADSFQHLEVPPPVPPKDPLPTLQPVSSLWKSFSFLPFLRDNPHQVPERPSTPDTLPPPLPHRGDVVCLGYNTLDDRQMRRLEGKSDHRPVIGAYALYI